MRSEMFPTISRRRVLTGALSSLTVVAVAACSSEPVPRDSYYRLGTPTVSQQRSGGPIKGVVEVPPLRGAGLVNERAILYRDTPQQLAQYSYHAWIEPPSGMLQQSLIDALRQAQAFDTVVSPEMRLDRDFEMFADLQQWEHVRGENVAAIEIEIALRRVQGHRQLLLKTYRAKEPAAGAGIDAVVGAFTRGMDSIYKELIADLGALPK